MPNALFARNNYKNGNYLPYDPDDPAIMNRMPVFLMFCENCIVDEVGGFPGSESGQPLNWIVDLGGINNRIIGSPPATPEGVPHGIGNMLSDQKKAEMEQLRRIR